MHRLHRCSRWQQGGLLVFVVVIWMLWGESDSGQLDVPVTIRCQETKLIGTLVLKHHICGHDARVEPVQSKVHWVFDFVDSLIMIGYSRMT